MVGVCVRARAWVPVCCANVCACVQGRTCACAWVGVWVCGCVGVGVCVCVCGWVGEYALSCLYAVYAVCAGGARSSNSSSSNRLAPGVKSSAVSTMLWRANDSAVSSRDLLDPAVGPLSSLEPTTLAFRTADSNTRWGGVLTAVSHMREPSLEDFRRQLP
jgi:hypothetical protein